MSEDDKLKEKIAWVMKELIDTCPEIEVLSASDFFYEDYDEKVGVFIDYRVPKKLSSLARELTERAQLNFHEINLFWIEKE